MAFYQDQNRRNKDQKRQSAQMRGGFEDEGSRYSGARGSAAPGKGRGSSRFPGARQEEGRFGGQRSGPRPQGGRPGEARPGEARGFAPRGQGPRPQGNSRFQGGPQGDSPRFGPRPYDNRPPRGPQEEQRGYRPPRPSQDQGRTAPPPSRPYRAPGSAAPRPPRPSRAPENASPRPPRPYGAPAHTAPRPTQPARSYGPGPSAAPPSPRPSRPADSYRYNAPAPYVPAVPVEATENLPPENLLSGRNPIREALKSGRDIEKLLVARGELSGSAREIVQMAKERHIPVQEVDRVRLDGIASGHQGMLAFASAYQYHTLEDMLALAKEKGQAPFLVLLDGITDPHNLGAIIRSAECAGAHGVIVQERRAVGLTPAAVKASAGAVEYLPVARVTNLTQTIAQLQKENIWVFAADMEGEDYASVDFSGPIALVIGAEGEGVSRLVLEACDRKVSLPVRGQLDSLNASVAAGILLYAAMKGR